MSLTEDSSDVGRPSSKVTIEEPDDAQSSRQVPEYVRKRNPSGMSQGQAAQQKKLGHRRVDKGGQVSYRRRPVSELMGSLQVGLSHSIGSTEPSPPRDILMKDFSLIQSAIFPSEGSDRTPAHRWPTFRFKTFAPEAFRYFRHLYNIQADDYMLSLCDVPMRELSNPGASGSIFFISEDDKFIIKTVQKKEAQFLQKLLPGYFLNLNQAENFSTLLPKFYGLYCYQHGGKNIRFVVMNNLLPSDVSLDEKYDLKGSTYKRRASDKEIAKSNPTLKDLDFRDRHAQGIYLGAKTYRRIVSRIERDCTVLESFKIMDYSLLLGIKYQEVETDAAQSDREHDGGVEETPMPDTLLRRQGSRFGTDNTAPFSCVPAWTERGEPVHLYVGIIDILQNWRTFKKLEHNLKAAIAERDTISVHRPSFYAERFRNFVCKQVFRKKDTTRPLSVRKKRGMSSRHVNSGPPPPDLLHEATDGQGTIPRSPREEVVHKTILIDSSESKVERRERRTVTICDDNASSDETPTVTEQPADKSSKQRVLVKQQAKDDPDLTDNNPDVVDYDADTEATFTHL